LPYIGQKPANKPVSASDLEDGIITNAKLAQDIISAETELAEAPASTDEFLISDGGTLKRLDASFIGGDNTPSFFAYADSSTVQSFGNGTWVKMQVDTQVYDTDSCYDHSSNYRFTPNVAGKYCIFGQTYIDGTSDGYHITGIYKNGSLYTYNVQNFVCAPIVKIILDFNGSSDYVELYGRQNSGTTRNSDPTNKLIFFGGYKIIT